MTITLEILAEREEAIRQAAERRGLSVEAWVKNLVEAGAPVSNVPVDDEEWLRRFCEWVDGHDPNTPVLSDEAMSRESIY
jgi:hypothetical protein